MRFEREQFHSLGSGLVYDKVKGKLFRASSVEPCTSVEASPEIINNNSPQDATTQSPVSETVADPPEEDPVPDQPAEEPEDDTELEEVLEHSMASLSAGILSMSLPVGVPPYQEVTTVILDTGSSQTIIDVDFARKLHISLTPQRTMRVTFVDRIVDVQVRDCQVKLLSQDKTQQFVVAARAIENLAGHAVLWPWNRYLHRHPHLEDIQVPKGPASCKGTILIGTDNVELLQALEYRQTNRSNRPMGLRTTLGWAFMGPDPEGKESLPSDKKIKVVPALKTSGLEKLLQRQFDIENLGTLEEEPSPFPSSNQGPKDPGRWSPDERLADTMMSVRPVSENGTTFFEGKIPWRRGHHPRLQENARAVRLCQENTHAPDKLKKKGIDISEIDAIIGGYLEKGYIEPVPKAEEDQGWYLPFFDVVNRQKSTPICLVFDAKAKHRGTSLNNQILDTPNRLNDLTIVLTRMRLYCYVLARDITEMFLQIRLNPEDKQYH
jgi:hypothetical protein